MVTIETSGAISQSFVLYQKMFITCLLCIKIVRRIYVLVTPGSERVKCSMVFIVLLLKVVELLGFALSQGGGGGGDATKI